MSTHIKTIILALGVVLGITIGEKSTFASEIAVTACILFILQLLVYVFENRKSDTEGVALSVSFSLITILFSVGLCIGIIRVQFVEEKKLYVCESSCTFNAKIISSPETKNDYQVFVIHPDVNEENILDIQVRAPLYPKYSVGEEIRVSGVVRVPSTLFPHSNETLPVTSLRGFDYAVYLAAKNIGSEMMYPHVEIIDEDTHTVGDYLIRWKEDLIKRSDNYIRSPASSLASGMLFGASSMSMELSQTFRIAGLSHIVVLSGFNIAIVITTILFVLLFVPLLLRIILATCAVIIFVVMVGGEASVLRATLMAFIGLLALVTGREYVARQALIISFLLIVLYKPITLLHDVSLHLSFLATSGIIYLSTPIKKIMRSYLEYIKSRSLQELFVTTVSAYLFTLPYIMYTFGTVSVYALIANILVLPLVPLTMLLSIFTVIFSYVSQIVAMFFGYFDTVLLTSMIWIAQMIETFPYSTFPFSVSFAGMVYLYIGIIVVTVYLSRKSVGETHYKDKDGNLTDIINY